MKIKLIKYRSKDELMLAIHVFDEDGNEIDSYQFYNNELETKKEPLLRNSIEKLPDFIKILLKLQADVSIEEDEIFV